MPEEQNHDTVTLADILDEVKRQHRDSKLFAAYLFSGAVFLAGVGFHVASANPPLGWQMFNAYGFMSLGVVSAIGFWAYHFWKMRKGKALKVR